MFDYHRQHGIGEIYALVLVPLFTIQFEANLIILRKFHVTEIRIARIFNTYGPRMNIDDGRVVSNFIAQAIR